mmetsp:Transcript_28380/g.25225  ORF Transcript_28380/g.25225 Transcript_28380/m.25225 type:complete len:96 (+) Transcript_28380:719-1006(+)
MLDSVGLTMPFGLNTSQIQVLFPNILNQFNPNLGMYIEAGVGGGIPQIRIRDGRVAATMSLLMAFWVDTTSTDYPAQGFKDCVSQGNCQKYVQVN